MAEFGGAETFCRKDKIVRAESSDGSVCTRKTEAYFFPSYFAKYPHSCLIEPGIATRAAIGEKTPIDDPGSAQEKQNDKRNQQKFHGSSWHEI